MENLENYNVIELNNKHVLEIQGGSLSDFGEWLTDTLAEGICGVKSWWNNLPKGYVPGEGAGYDGNAMGLPG